MQNAKKIVSYSIIWILQLVKQVSTSDFVAIWFI
jgi:hypothetical protein